MAARAPRGAWVLRVKGAGDGERGTCRARTACCIRPWACFHDVRLHDGRWLELGTWSDDDVVRIEPFDAVAIRLADLWG